MDHRCEASEEACTTSPEKHLLAAILELASRDLLCTSLIGKPGVTSIYIQRKKAVAWFKSEQLSDPAECSFTFEEVKSELQLSAHRVQYLKERVAAAEKILLAEKIYIEKQNVKE